MFKTESVGLVETRLFFLRLIGEDGTFLRFDQFTQNMDINYLNYFSVVSSLQTYLRKLNITLMPITMTICFLTLNIKEILKAKKRSKHIYIIYTWNDNRT